TCADARRRPRLIAAFASKERSPARCAPMTSAFTTTDACTAVPSLPVRGSAGGRAQLLRFGCEDVVEAVFGELDAGREPKAAGRLHVLDDAAQRQRSSRTTDDVGMHGERNIFRALGRALRIELVEIGLPGLEPVVRIAILAVTVAEQRAVTE